MDEAIPPHAAINTLSKREIDVLKRRFGVQTIDCEYLNNVFAPQASGDDTGAAPGAGDKGEFPPDSGLP